MIVTKMTEAKINGYLNLPSTGREQDWAIEMANPDRLEEFLLYYIEHNKQLSDEENYALMGLVLYSYDEYLYKNDSLDIWDTIRGELMANKELFKEIIDYWSLWDEGDKNNWFNLTALMRELPVPPHSRF